MKNFVKSFVFTFLACVFLQNLSAQTPYLGQTPPGLIPQRFAPSNIQSNGVWFWRTAPAFAPDGTEMFFAKYHTKLLITKVMKLVFTKLMPMFLS